MAHDIRSRRSAARRAQRGIAAILVAIGALALVGMAGLALDLGTAYIAKSQLQNALDAAALSGAKILNATNSTTQAEAAARADFAANMTISGLTVSVEFSPTLVPFASGLNPRFVRVTVASRPVALRLISALPGIGNSMDVSGSAVAGRMPKGDNICSALPIAVCGTGSDKDCSDGDCFGYPAGPTDELELKGDNSALGPGNYGLVELSCGTGKDCVREGMAGGEQVCFSQSGSLTTEPGVASGPTSQGLNTRFGIYKGPVSESEYPADVITRSLPLFPIYHTDYEALVSLGPIAWDKQIPPARLHRRIATIPVIDCTTPVTGTSTVPLIGGACFFLTRPVEGSGVNAGYIYGQLIPSCEADGSAPDDPDPDSPFYDIRLFRDPASTQS